MKTLHFISLSLKQHKQLRLSSALRCVLVTILISAKTIDPPDGLLIIIDLTTMSAVLVFLF